MRYGHNIVRECRENSFNSIFVDITMILDINSGRKLITELLKVLSVIEFQTPVRYVNR